MTVVRKKEISALIAGGVMMAALAGDAWAEATVSTDRPSFGASASVVPENMVQLEGGVDVISDDSTSLSLPLFLLRAGVSDALELRLGLPSITFQEGENTLGALSLGLKIAGPVSDSISLGVLPTLTIPTGEETLFDDADYGVTALMDVALTDRLGLSLNFGAAIVERDQRGEASRQLQQNAAVALGFAIGGGFAAYAEVYEVWQPSAEEIALGVDGGVTWGVLPWLQLDVYANAGLSGDLPAITTGVGIGILGP